MHNRSTEGESEAGPSFLDEAREWDHHVIVCGLHNLGFRIVGQLRSAGIKIVAIDDEPDVRIARQVARWGVPIIQEDSRNPDTLAEAGLSQASAIIACEETDLHNLDIILLANEMKPGIRAVASFLNQRIGEQLSQVLANARALSMSEKAAPAFVEACNPSSVLHLFNLHGDDVAVVEARVTRSGTFTELYPNSTVLLVSSHQEPRKVSFLSSGRPNLARTHPVQNVEKAICPDPDNRLEPGQYVTLLGKISDLEKLEGVALQLNDLVDALASMRAIQSDLHESNRQRSLRRRLKRRRWFLNVRRFTGHLLRDIDRPFRFALLTVGLIIGITSVFLWLFYRSTMTDASGAKVDFNLLDALYFTVTIITTAGFGDYNFSLQDWELKLFGILLMLVGAGSMSVVYAYVTNFVISRRLEQTLGRQKATNMENHIIICGLGSVGYRVMQGLLEQNKSVAVIEKNEDGRFNSEARSMGVPVIIGDAKLPQVLKAVNIKQAQAAAFLTSDSLANLEAAMGAHAEFHNYAENREKTLRVVMRVFDNSLAERVSHTFNVQAIYSTSSLAAPYFVAAALDYEVVTTFYVNRNPFIVARVQVKAEGRLDEMTVQEFYLETATRVIAILEAESEQPVELPDFSGVPKAESVSTRQFEPLYWPEPDRVLKAGEFVYYIGAYERAFAGYRLNHE